MDDTHDKLSRRALLRGAAVASTSQILAACSSSPAGPNPDIIALNILLNAEYTSIAAYASAVTNLGAPPSGDPLATYAFSLAAIATKWSGQHNTHATLLASTITGLGGTPITQASVSYSPPAGQPANPSITNVLITLANQELTNSTSYAAAVANLSATATRFLAGNICGDETQHFTVLYALINKLVTPGSMLASVGTSNVVPVPFVVTPVGMSMTGIDTGVLPFTYP